MRHHSDSARRCRGTRVHWSRPPRSPAAAELHQGGRAAEGGAIPRPRDGPSAGIRRVGAKSYP
eukprot:1345201-Pyramimonas_sp.AAC.1